MLASVWRTAERGTTSIQASLHLQARVKTSLVVSAAVAAATYSISAQQPPAHRVHFEAQCFLKGLLVARELMRKEKSLHKKGETDEALFVFLTGYSPRNTIKPGCSCRTDSMHGCTVSAAAISHSKTHVQEASISIGRLSKMVN